MKRAAFVAMIVAASSPLAPAAAIPGGEIHTLPTGQYVCELPGDAAGPFRIRTPEQDFAVVSASSYKVGSARGTYLLTGKNMVMTSGPFKGRKFQRLGDGFLRHLGPDAAIRPMRCVLSTRNNS